MRERIVAGNWKMNGSRALLASHAACPPRQVTMSDVRVIWFPPALYLAEAAQLAGSCGVEVGIQTVHPQIAGAHTGELAAEMAADVGAGWALLGHSERRRDRGEDDAEVGAQVRAALRAGLRPMLCVGETLAERDSGQAEAVVLAQLAAAAELAGEEVATGAIAYEPVWAIGTGRTATPEQVQAMHGAIRGTLRQRGSRWADMPVLYGGSVKPDNAQELFACEDVDGALVGGASLDPQDFRAIVATMESHGNL